MAEFVPKLAIFKGFPFRYRDLGRSHEAELEVRRYVGGPIWDVVENSSGPDEITVQAVFLGPLAATEKAAFLLLLNSLPGPGTLIHPDLGVSVCYLRSWQMSTSGVTQGVIALDLTFMPVVDLPGAEIAFAATMDAVSLTVLAAGAGAVYGATGGDASAAAEASAGVQSRSLAASVASLILQPTAKSDVAISAAAASNVAGMVDAWGAVAGYITEVDAAQSAMDAASALWTDALSRMDRDFATASVDAAIAEAVTSVFLCREMTLALGVTYAVADDAEAAASALWSRATDVITRASDAGIVSALVRGRAAAYGGLIRDAVKLPRRTLLAVESSQSIFDLAMRAYGSIDDADALTADNAIIHPGFLPTGDYRVVR